MMVLAYWLAAPHITGAKKVRKLDRKAMVKDSYGSCGVAPYTQWLPATEALERAAIYESLWSEVPTSHDSTGKPVYSWNSSEHLYDPFVYTLSHLSPSKHHILY